MKRLFVYISTLILLASCAGEQARRYTLSGSGIDQGTVFLFGYDENYQELGATKSNGSFSFSLPLEQATRLTLILPDSKELTLFAEPGTTAILYPDSTLKSGWSVKGGPMQNTHDSISRILDACPNIEEQKKHIDNFVKHHPMSDINVEIFRRYMVEIPNPNNDYLRKAISKMGGVLQDKEYIAHLKKRLDKKTGDVKHRITPTYNYTTIEGEEVSPATYANKYLLLTIWGSWNNSSRTKLKMLRTIDEQVKSDNFAILNIALDSDTARLRNIIESDTIIGDNAYDPQGLNSSTLNSFNIDTLPYSVLITPYKRITEYNFKLDNRAAEYLDSLTRAHDRRRAR